MSGEGGGAEGERGVRTGAGRGEEGLVVRSFDKMFWFVASFGKQQIQSHNQEAGVTHFLLPVGAAAACGWP